MHWGGADVPSHVLIKDKSEDAVLFFIGHKLQNSPSVRRRGERGQIATSDGLHEAGK